MSTYNSRNVIERYELVKNSKKKRILTNQMSLSLSLTADLNQRIENAMRHAVLLADAKDEVF